MKCNIVKVTFFVINILSVCKAYFLDANLFQKLEELPILCQIKNVAVTVTPTDLEDILSYLRSQQDKIEFLRDSLAIETQLLEEAFSKPVAYDEDQDLNVTELISKYGYTPEVHEITTEDGYKLTMYRIVGKGPVVFLMHGVLNSSDDWVTPGPGSSLAYMLATEGFDVWLGNARGNKHSRKHISLSPKCEEFWEFSWDQISLIDVPTMIDYALNVSGKSNLTYVGHSQGTTNLLALCSDLPEYNKKISIAALLAPVGYLTHMTSPILRLAFLNPDAIYKVTQLLGLNNPMPNIELTNVLTAFFCGNNAISKYVCGNLVGLVGGYGKGQLNLTSLPVILSHSAAGASFRQLIHYAQEGRAGKFQKFDFTKQNNLEMYGSELPPEYNLDNVTVPVAMFYGGYDWLANATDVNQLRDELPNVVYTKFLEEYGHVDFIWAKNAKELVYNPLLELIKNSK